MFELVIVWSTGEKNIYSYDTRDRAEEAEDGMRMVFGNQIQWTGVRRKYEL